MKRLLCLFLALLIFPTTIAFAKGSYEEPFYYQASRLYDEGLFKGTGTDQDGDPVFELDRAPSREEAVTMLVRMLGAENIAIEGNWHLPFSDVSAWARPYVGYAYSNGLTAGTSATTFDGSETVTATQFITLMLRALGYQSGIDFEWDKAWVLADKLGITNRSTTDYKNGGTGPNDLFIRGDAACLMYALLDQRVTLKNSDMTINRSIMNTRTRGIPAEESTFDGCPSFTLADTSIDALTDCMAFGAEQGYECFYIFVPEYGLFEYYNWFDPAEAFFHHYNQMKESTYFTGATYYGAGLLGIGPAGTCTFEIHVGVRSAAPSTPPPPAQDVSDYTPDYYDQWGRGVFIDEFGHPYYFDSLGYPTYVGTPVDEHYGEYPPHDDPVYYDDQGRAVYLHASGFHYIIDSEGLICFIDS